MSRISKALSLILALFFLISTALPAFSEEKVRAVRVTINVDIKNAPDAKSTRIWIPYPMSDQNQKIENVKIEGNYSYMGIYREGAFLNTMLYAEWNGQTPQKQLVYTFDVKRKEVIKKDFPEKEYSFSKKEFERYLDLKPYGVSEAKLKGYVDKITKGKKTVLAKARAIYDWTFENMRRDPSVKGCGMGDVERLLTVKGGKCADIHSVFVALLRSAGIPARECFGIRIPKGNRGDMTKAQHCWAEFYLPGYGWVVADPADVTKIMLEKNLSPKDAKGYADYYFGAVDENRIAFGTGRNIILSPSQSSGALNYFMYPYAEVDGKPLNEDLYGFNIGYRISFEEI